MKIKIISLLLIFLLFVGFTLSGCLPKPSETKPLPTTTPSLGSEPYIKSISPLSGTPGTKVTILGSGFGTARGSSQLIFRNENQISTELNIITWLNTNISARVPLLMVDTYQVIVVVNGIESNAVEFKVYEGSMTTPLPITPCPSCNR